MGAALGICLVLYNQILQYEVPTCRKGSFAMSAIQGLSGYVGDGLQLQGHKHFFCNSRSEKNECLGSQYAETIRNLLH